MAEEIVVYKIDYKELEKLIKEYLGITDDLYNLVGDLGNNDPRWMNDTVHWVDVEPETMWFEAVHNDSIAEIKRKRKVEWGWELQAVMNELGKAGKLAVGPHIVNVCW